MSDRWRIITGDALATLRGLPASEVQCCVTSPPYWGLRDYGVDGQLGHEPTPDEWVARLVEVFRECRRVLRQDGTLWLNVGDAYARDPRCGVKFQTGPTTYRSNRQAEQGNRGMEIPPGTKPKDLLGLPWLLAFALRADGWYLRSDIIWHKPNGQPESVRDRPTRAHEYLFLLSVSERYYYDPDPLREPHADPRAPGRGGVGAFRGQAELRPRGNLLGPHRYYHPLGRNCRDVWSIAVRPGPEAHFATFPPELPRRCILASSHLDDLVLDPFSGTATTGVVAMEHGRRYLGIELSPTHAETSRHRLAEAEQRGGVIPPPRRLPGQMSLMEDR